MSPLCGIKKKIILETFFPILEVVHNYRNNIHSQERVFIVSLIYHLLYK